MSSNPDRRRLRKHRTKGWDNRMNICQKTFKEHRMEFQQMVQGIEYFVCVDCGDMEQQYQENHGC